MQTFLATLTPMLTLFLCITIGYVSYKAKLLPDGAGKVMAKMETWIFCPALCFVTMVRYCTVDTLSTHAVNVTVASLSVAIAMAISLTLVRLFAKRGTSDYGVYCYALAFANSGYLGDPIVLALFGEEILSYYKLFCLPISLVIYTWGISVLTPQSGEKGAAFKRLLNAPTIATLIGVALGLLGVGPYLPSFLMSSLDSLKACMGPVGMLLAGVTIARYDLFGMLKKTKVYVASLLRLTIIPAIIISLLFVTKYGLGLLLGTEIGHDVLFLAFFAVAAPLGLNTVVFPEAYGGNPETGASMTLISHTLGVITIPILYALMVMIFGTPFGA